MSRLVEAVIPSRLGRPFRWLLGASWVSNLGDGIALAAAPLLIAEQTHDPVLVALSIVLQRLPWALFGLLAGVVADRVDRRTIIVIVHAAQAAVLATLAATIVLDQVNVTIVLVTMFLLGTGETFVDVTTQTLPPMIVDSDDLGIANARITAGFLTVNQLVGPPLGAALFAAGSSVPFIAQAVCMVIGAAFTWRITLPIHGREKRVRSRIRREIADGWRWLWKNAAVRTLALTIFIFNLTYGAAFSVLVLYSIERLHAGDVGFGLLTTMIALGGLGGTAIYGWLTDRVSLGNIMRAGLIIETFTHAALALTTTEAVAFGIMLIFGAHAAVWMTTSQTVRQRAVPTALQGRVGSVYLIGVQVGLIVGGLIGGAIAGAADVTAPFWFAFVGSGILVVLIWRQLPLIGRADSRTTEARDPSVPVRRPPARSNP